MECAPGTPLARLEDYRVLEQRLAELASSDPSAWAALVRAQAEGDLYFLLRYVLSTRDLGRDPTGASEPWFHNPWIYQQTRAIQYEYDRTLNVWAREHMKSTIGNFGLNFWLFINNPGHCIGIFSVLRSLAKAHLRRMMHEMENNPLLSQLWPEIFWERPASQAKPWSIEEGCILKSCAARNEVSLEAWPLTESYPAGKHFNHLCVDDMSAPRTVATDDQLMKAREGYNLLGGLQSRGATRIALGTFYSDTDVQIDLIRDGALTPRLRPAVDSSDNSEEYQDIGGRPVYYSAAELRMKMSDMNEEYAIQYLLDPLKGRNSLLDASHLQTYGNDPVVEAQSKSLYLLADPNGWQDPENDPCALMLVGLGFDRNFYVLDLFKGRVDPGDRLRAIVSMHKRWVEVVGRTFPVWIEETAAQNDSFHIRTEMDRQHHRFEVAPIQIARHDAKGPLSKFRRIMKAWSAPLKASRIWLPRRLWREYDGKEVDMVRDLQNEVKRFPMGKQDHFLAGYSMLFAQQEEDMKARKRAAPPLTWPDSPLYGQRNPYAGPPPWQRLPFQGEKNSWLGY